MEDQPLAEFNLQRNLYGEGNSPSGFQFDFGVSYKSVFHLSPNFESGPGYFVFLYTFVKVPSVSTLKISHTF